MALVIINAFLQSDNGKDVGEYDLTGSTSATAYGVGGNNVPADFDGAATDIYFPDSSTLMPLTTIGATTDVFPTLPTLTTTTSFALTSLAVFGSDQVWANGIYRFVTNYTLAASDVTFQTDVKVPIIRGVLCCINTLILQAEDCGCTGKDFIILLKAKMYLNQLTACSRELGGLSSVEVCDLWNKAARIIKAAVAICNNAGCNPCGTCNGCS